MTERRIVTEDRGGKVLVTGAAGFVGRAVVAVLAERGWRVHGVVSSSTPAAREGVTWHQANLLDPDGVDSLLAAVEPSHLIHLAWAPNRGIYDSLENFRWVEASLVLMRRFAAAGGSRAVFAGSCAEYDWSAGKPLVEDSALARATAYGAAKGSLGRLFTDYCALGPLSGAWARLFFLFGPAEPRERLVPAVITSLLHGEPARCSHGEQRRDYLYVGDAADALERLLASAVEGPINIASGEATRLKDLIGEIARRLDGENLIELGALETGAAEADLVVAEVGRLRQEVGWEPRGGLAEGLEETIRWWTRRLTH